jgi:lysophospholipase L1-like esterase
MRKNWILVAAVALGVGALAVAVGGSSGVRVGPGDKVLLIGDSLAQGLRAPLRKLAEGAGVEFASEAEQGTRVDQWVKGRASSAVDQEQPTVVVISLGTNDEAVPSDEWRAAFAAKAQALVADLMARGPRAVVWIIPPDMPFAAESIQQITDGIMASGAVTFDSRGLDIPRGPDNIHPTIEGTAGWAAAVWSALVR